MKSVTTPLAVGALALVVSACGAGRAEGEGPAEAEPTFEVTVEVENQDFYDARVYLLEFGRRTRLGNVSGNSTRTLRFRPKSGEARFLVDFIGSGEITTTGIKVSPGDKLVLTVSATTQRLRLRG